MKVVLTSNPRSGTHYMKALLSAALGIPALEQNLDTPGDLRTALAEAGGRALIYGHFRYSQHGAILDERLVPGLRIIVLTRHPFDRLISELAREKALKGNLPHPDHSPQRLARDLLLGHWDRRIWSCGLIVPNYPELHNFYLRDLVTNWVAQRHGLLVKYEELTRDPIAMLRRCLAFLGVAQPTVKLESIVRRINFANLSGGRAPGEIDTLAHYRRGLPGEWLEVFLRADLPALRRRYAEALATTGYQLEPKLEHAIERPNARTFHEVWDLALRIGLNRRAGWDGCAIGLSKRAAAKLMLLSFLLQNSREGWRSIFDWVTHILRSTFRVAPPH